MARKAIIAAGLAALLSGPAVAGPDASVAPFQDSALASLEWGVFCVDREMDRAPAEGTVAGWVHVPREDIPFHWPGLRTVPAEIGIGFGIRAAAADWTIEDATVIVTRPGPNGTDLQESWTQGFGSAAPSFAFFRFDTPDELQPGAWDFQIYKDGERLAQVGFTVTDAAALPEMVNFCTRPMS